MKALAVSVLALGLALPGMAFAQSAGSGSQGGSQMGSQAGSQAGMSGNQGGNSLMTRQKLVQELQGAGFTNVNVVAEAFVVHATTKDGNPVVMTIGPTGMTAFEAVRPGTAGAASSGASGGSTGSSSTAGGGGSSAGSGTAGSPAHR